MPKIESSTVKQLSKVTDYPATDITARAAALNLTVLASLCGTPFMPDFSGMILILEDINEPVYKIDRMLTQLAINGVFSNLAMLIFGNFSGTESTELEMLFKRFADTLNIPCLSNFPFGHCFPMHAVNASQMMHIPALFQN